MTPDDSEQTIFMTKPEGLARILDVDATDLWSPEEMQAMWHHQLSAPIDIDLAAVTSVRATILRNSPQFASFQGKTFGDLFAHLEPPIELLELAKEFAKQTLKDSEETQLKEVASALYYASYAAGVVHYQKIIGSMKEDELRPGFNWALKQNWLDDQTKKVILAARQFLADNTKG